MNLPSTPPRTKSAIFRQHLPTAILLAFLSAWYVPILIIKLYDHRKHEFMSHIQSAVNLMLDFRRVEPFLLAHPLFHIITALVMKALLLLPTILRGITILLILSVIFSGVYTLMTRRQQALRALALPAAAFIVCGLIIAVFLLIDGEGSRQNLLRAWLFIQSDYPRLAAIIVLTTAYLWCGWMIFRAFRNTLLPPTKALPASGESLTGINNNRRLLQGASLFLAIGVMISADIPVLFFKDYNVYFGYIGFNVYNNATTNLLKPFALAATLYAFRCLDGDVHSWRETAAAAVLIVLSTLTKPNYIICLLPALSFLLALRCFNRHRIDWKYTFFGIILPAALVLLFQFAITYQGNGSNIRWMPFYVVRQYSQFLGEKILLSILFPLLVILLQPRAFLRDKRLQLTWVMFLIALFYSYFLAENAGGSIEDGNFGWSAEITLFLLYFISTLSWVEQMFKQRKPKKRDFVLALSWLLHLLSGIAFYIFMLLHDTYSYFPPQL